MAGQNQGLDTEGTVRLAEQENTHQLLSVTKFTSLEDVVII